MSETPQETVSMTIAEGEELARSVLTANGLSQAQTDAIVASAMAAQRDECHSHGLYRLIGYVKTARSDKADAKAEPTVSEPAPALVRVDGANGFAPLAFATGLPVLADKAKRMGIAAMGLNHCFNLSALWTEIEALTAHGLVGLICTPAHAWVAPAGGKRGIFGTNPIAFGWPRPSGHPYVFDFATSAIARGEIELRRRAGETIPEGWGVDAQGKATTDPQAVLEGAMLTFGGHKGSALAAMVELIAGPLIGDLTSAESMAFDEADGLAPYHGELVVAISPEGFLGDRAGEYLDRAEALFAGIVDQGARLPSQRRFEARERTAKSGITIPKALHDDLKALL